MDSQAVAYAQAYMRKEALGASFSRVPHSEDTDPVI